MLLISHQVCLSQPRFEVRVDIAGLNEPERMQVISGRERLDAAEARVVETSGKDKVTIEPAPARSDLRKGHSYLKCDPRLLGQDSHRANRPDCRDDVVEQRPDRRWLAAEVVGERVPAAGVRLIAIREDASAFPASPQTRPAGHRNPDRARAGPRISLARA